MPDFSVRHLAGWVQAVFVVEVFTGVALDALGTTTTLWPPPSDMVTESTSVPEPTVIGTEELAGASRPAVSLHSARNGTEFPRIRAVSLETHP